MLCAFIIPHHGEDDERLGFLRQTLGSIVRQTDERWIAVIADDASPYRDSAAVRSLLEDAAPGRVHVVESLSRVGPGANRNRAIRLAASLGASLILHQDDDDLAHEERVAVTRARFADAASLDVLYSPFIPIDRDGRAIERHRVRFDMLEVLEALDDGPLTGDDVFPAMVARTGFIATLSTVATRVREALSFPFPSGRASDDSHTWMRMAASGLRFGFAPEIPTRYRIAQQGLSDLGVNGRDRWFLLEKVQNDLDGFEQGVAILARRGVLTDGEVPPLTGRFLNRLADYVDRQGEAALARRLRSARFAGSVARRLSFDRAFGTGR